jgi:hypothetical protein
MSGGAQAAVRLPPVKTLLLSLVVAALIGAVIYAVRQETASRPQTSSASSFTAGLGDYRNAPALSMEEEVFAAALWPIHSEVKLSAVRMIFSGLSYKTEHSNARVLREQVQPLIRSFQGAAQRARALKPPASLADAHASYVEAVELYVVAARQMVRIAEDGREQHLVDAQQRSERASLALLKLSDVLWPGEYKPN